MQLKRNINESLFHTEEKGSGDRNAFRGEQHMHQVELLRRYCVFKYLFRSVAPVTRKPHALHARRHWEFFLFQKISTRRKPLDSALHSWSVSRTQRHACVSCKQQFLSRRPCCFRSPSVHNKSTSSPLAARSGPTDSTQSERTHSTLDFRSIKPHTVVYLVKNWQSSAGWVRGDNASYPPSFFKTACSVVLNQE